MEKSMALDFSLFYVNMCIVYLEILNWFFLNTLLPLFKKFRISNIWYFIVL